MCPCRHHLPWPPLLQRFGSPKAQHGVQHQTWREKRREEKREKRREEKRREERFVEGKKGEKGEKKERGKDQSAKHTHVFLFSTQAHASPLLALVVVEMVLGWIVKRPKLSAALAAASYYAYTRADAKWRCA